MAYDFKNIATVDVAETVSDTANVLIEDNGVIKKAAKNQFGGTSGGVTSWNDLEDKPFGEEPAELTLLNQYVFMIDGTEVPIESATRDKEYKLYIQSTGQVLNGIGVYLGPPFYSNGYEFSDGTTINGNILTIGTELAKFADENISIKITTMGTTVIRMEEKFLPENALCMTGDIGNIPIIVPKGSYGREWKSMPISSHSVYMGNDDMFQHNVRGVIDKDLNHNNARYRFCMIINNLSITTANAHLIFNDDNYKINIQAEDMRENMLIFGSRIIDTLWIFEIYDYDELGDPLQRFSIRMPETYSRTNFGIGGNQSFNADFKIYAS